MLRRYAARTIRVARVLASRFPSDYNRGDRRVAGVPACFAIRAAEP